MSATIGTGERCTIAGKPGGIGRILDRHAYDLAAFHRERVDLFERRIGVGGIGRGHRLHDDRMIAADPDALGVGLPGLVLQEDRFGFAAQTNHDLEHSLARHDAGDVVEGNQ